MTQILPNKKYEIIQGLAVIPTLRFSWTGLTLPLDPCQDHFGLEYQFGTQASNSLSTQSVN